MAGQRSLHARTALVVTVAATVVVATTTFAAAQHDGDTSVLHACVAKGDGQLRLLQDPTSSCRPNETPVQWSAGSDSGQALESFIAALDTADTEGGANDGDGLVDWSNLDAVPDSLLTAGARLDAFSAELAAEGSGQLLHWSNLFAVPEVLADGTIEFRDLTGHVTAGQLAMGSVVGGPAGAVLDGSITASDLAGRYCDADGDGDLDECQVGAVTGETLADGAVESRDLADGSVTSDKLALSSVTYGSVSSSLLTGASAADHPAGFTHAVTTDGARRVLVAAQAQLSCLCSEVHGLDALVSYQLVRTSDPASPSPTYTPASPVYSVEMNPYVRQFPVSLTVFDTANAGDHVYRLRVLPSGDREVTVHQAQISAQVLGAP